VIDIHVAKPSVQSLLIEMRFGSQLISTGTGFIVEGRLGPLLITNRHNVTGRHQETQQPLSPTGGVPDNLMIVHNRASKSGWIYREEWLYIDDTPRWHEHPRFGAAADFVALPLLNTGDAKMVPYNPAGPGADIAIGPADIVSVVGFPFGLSGGGSFAIWATGFVASELSLPNQPTFLIDCRSRRGQSGSAVIAYRAGGAVPTTDGEVVILTQPATRFLGIYSGRINEESDLGIVWKASAIAELIASI
jgi:hypothetical protein